MRAIIVSEKFLEDCIENVMAKLIARTSNQHPQADVDKNAQLDGRVSCRAVNYELYDMLSKLKDAVL